MPCVIRWSVCLAVCGLLGASAPTRSQGLQVVLIVYSPRQLVEVPDADGNVRLAQFEANVRAYEDGSARGGAVLHVRGNERHEFRFERLLELESNELGVQAATFEVRLESVKKPLIDKGFGFIRDESGIEHMLIYDIQIPNLRGGFVFDTPFVAEGTLIATSRPRG